METEAQKGEAACPGGWPLGQMGGWVLRGSWGELMLFDDVPGVRVELGRSSQPSPASPARVLPPEGEL